MRCTEWCGRASLAGLVWLAACSAPSGGPGEGVGPKVAPEQPAAPEPRPAAGGSTAPLAAARLPAPRAVRNWNDVRLQAAQRIVSATPGGTYLGVVPDVLLAVPVLEIELNGDGSIRKIEILRYPREAKDTVQLATDAVRRAAPFGDVSRLPRPWKFVETFLFDEARKFKPRTLDQ